MMKAATCSCGNIIEFSKDHIKISPPPKKGIHQDCNGSDFGPNCSAMCVVSSISAILFWHSRTSFGNYRMEAFENAHQRIPKELLFIPAEKKKVTLDTFYLYRDTRADFDIRFKHKMTQIWTHVKTVPIKSLLYDEDIIDFALSVPTNVSDAEAYKLFLKQIEQMTDWEAKKLYDRAFAQHAEMRQILREDGLHPGTVYCRNDMNMLIDQMERWLPKYAGKLDIKLLESFLKRARHSMDYEPST